MLVAVDDLARDHDRRAGPAGGPLVAELERVLALEHDEAVGVLAVEVPARAALGARAHVGEDELGAVDEHVDRRLGNVHEGLASARHLRSSLTNNLQAAVPHLCRSNQGFIVLAKECEM